jgi:hypothetical protein
MKKLILLATALLMLGTAPIHAQKTNEKTKTTISKTKKDGTPDKRYKENKKLKKDGTPDKRYKDNKKK